METTRLINPSAQLEAETFESFVPASPPVPVASRAGSCGFHRILPVLTSSRHRPRLGPSASCLDDCKNSRQVLLLQILLLQPPKVPYQNINQILSLQRLKTASVAHCLFKFHMRLFTSSVVCNLNELSSHHPQRTRLRCLTLTPGQ